MKRILTISSLWVFTIVLLAQAPQKVSYQAIIRNSSDDIVKNASIGMQISILKGSVTGTPVFVERHVTTSNSNGLISFEIGNGINISGDFSIIEWSIDSYFIKSEVDLNGGTSYTISGTSQILSVPYAMYANSVGAENQNISDVLSKGSDAGNKPITNLSKVVVGGTPVSSSAIVEIISTTQGFAPPKMSEEQMLAIPSPAQGLMIFNTTNKKLMYFNGAEWRIIEGSSFILPENSIFVSPGGHDTPEAGTRDLPCKTISYALNLTGNSKMTILVANGIYNESITIRDGINIYGGFNPVSWDRDCTLPLTIIKGSADLSNNYATIIANGIASSTIVEGLVIFGRNNSNPGGNSYGVYISGSSDKLEFRHCLIYAGNGADGINGSDGIMGRDGTNGSGRENNPVGYDAFITSGSPCNSTNNRQYINGGILTTFDGENVSGGNGGGNRCAPVPNSIYSAISGTAGRLNGGSGGNGGFDSEIINICYLGGTIAGINGQNGLNGLDGNGGAGGSSDQWGVVQGHWYAQSGFGGTNGKHGSGAGGGGAGGGSKCTSNCNSKDLLGGHGGGGGSGGEAGRSGSGGIAGGGSFGIFIMGGSAPVITNCEIYSGEGGDGGNGGYGGRGGRGGEPGMGGLSSIFCCGTGGRGGYGGSGGDGGSGGGGCGGSSFGIFTYNVSGVPDYLSQNLNNEISAGIAGNGGTGNGSNGASGIAYLVSIN